MLSITWWEEEFFWYFRECQAKGPRSEFWQYNLLVLSMPPLATCPFGFLWSANHALVQSTSCSLITQVHRGLWQSKIELYVLWCKSLQTLMLREHFFFSRSDLDVSRGVFKRRTRLWNLDSVCFCMLVIYWPREASILCFHRERIQSQLKPPFKNNKIICERQKLDHESLMERG